MDTETMLAFVLERHPQAIYQVKSGRHAGSWTTKYYENGIKRAKIYQDKQDLIQNETQRCGIQAPSELYGRRIPIRG